MCQEPFTQMVHKYQNLVFSICVKMTGDYFAAEDLTQETFLSAYRHKEEFDGKNEKAWLCRIASNKCIDYSRQAARRMVPTEDEVLGSHPARAGGPEEQCIEEVVREELQEKCGQLKPPYDEIAKLYFCEEHPAGAGQRVHHAAEGHLPHHRHRRQGNGLRRSGHLRPNLRADVPPHRHRLHLSAAGHGIQLAAKFTGKEAASK